VPKTKDTAPKATPEHDTLVGYVVRPMKPGDRANKIESAIREMTIVEVGYWLGRIYSATNQTNAVRALRMLVG